MTLRPFSIPGAAAAAMALFAWFIPATGRDVGGEGTGKVRIPAERHAGNFGPLEDGREGSHSLLEKQGWIYLFDGRVPATSPKWDPLGLWRLRHEDPARNLWSVIEENGFRVLRNAAGIAGTDLISKQGFWDFDLHIEVKADEGPSGGVLLRGRYEIELAGTPAEKPAGDLGPDDMGGIGDLRPPAVNSSRGPGKWQTIDLSLRGFRVTVRLNGEPIQDSVEIPEEKRRGTEAGLRAEEGAILDPERPGPIVLRGGEGPVEFRSIRVRPRPAPAIWRATRRGG